jgi:hypothetical protein
MRRIKPLGKSSFASKMVRALVIHREGAEFPLPPQEEKHPGVSAYYSHKEIRNDVLRSIRLKDIALMEYQRQKNLPR